MTDDRSEDKSFENETQVTSMVRIPLSEYEALRNQGKMITDSDLIAVIDKLEELVRVLRRRIVRKDYWLK